VNSDNNNLHLNQENEINLNFNNHNNVFTTSYFNLNTSNLNLKNIKKTQTDNNNISNYKSITYLNTYNNLIREGNLQYIENEERSLLRGKTEDLPKLKKRIQMKTFKRDDLKLNHLNLGSESDKILIQSSYNTNKNKRIPNNKECYNYLGTTESIVSPRMSKTNVPNSTSNQYKVNPEFNLLNKNEIFKEKKYKSEIISENEKSNILSQNMSKISREGLLNNSNNGLFDVKRNFPNSQYFSLDKKELEMQNIFNDQENKLEYKKDVFSMNDNKSDYKGISRKSNNQLIFLGENSNNSNCSQKARENLDRKNKDIDKEENDFSSKVKKNTFLKISSLEIPSLNKNLEFSLKRNNTNRISENYENLKGFRLESSKFNNDKEKEEIEDIQFLEVYDNPKITEENNDNKEIPYSLSFKRNCKDDNESSYNELINDENNIYLKNYTGEKKIANYPKCKTFESEEKNIYSKGSINNLLENIFGDENSNNNNKDYSHRKREKNGYLNNTAEQKNQNKFILNSEKKKQISRSGNKILDGLESISNMNEAAFNNWANEKKEEEIKKNLDFDNIDKDINEILFNKHDAIGITDFNNTNLPNFYKLEDLDFNKKQTNKSLKSLDNNYFIRNNNFDQIEVNSPIINKENNMIVNLRISEEKQIESKLQNEVNRAGKILDDNPNYQINVQNYSLVLGDDQENIMNKELLENEKLKTIDNHHETKEILLTSENEEKSDCEYSKNPIRGFNDIAVFRKNNSNDFSYNEIKISKNSNKKETNSLHEINSDECDINYKNGNFNFTNCNFKKDLIHEDNKSSKDTKNLDKTEENLIKDKMIFLSSENIEDILESPRFNLNKLIIEKSKIDDFREMKNINIDLLNPISKNSDRFYDKLLTEENKNESSKDINKKVDVDFITIETDYCRDEKPNPTNFEDESNRDSNVFTEKNFNCQTLIRYNITDEIREDKEDLFTNIVYKTKEINDQNTILENPKQIMDSPVSDMNHNYNPTSINRITSITDVNTNNFATEDIDNMNNAINYSTNENFNSTLNNNIRINPNLNQNENNNDINIISKTSEDHLRSSNDHTEILKETHLDNPNINNTFNIYLDNNIINRNKFENNIQEAEKEHILFVPQGKVLGENIEINQDELILGENKP